MKLMRVGEAGKERPAVLHTDGSIRDLSAYILDITPDTLGDEALARLRQIDHGALPVVKGRPRIGACLGRVENFLCIGKNYADHAAEMESEPPAEPLLFSKSTRAIAGADDPIRLPRGSERTDWEVEVAIIIGKTARYISEAEAHEHIAGYCLVNDVSERDFQKNRAGQFIKGKSADSFGPIGPWFVTRDEIDNPQDIALYTEVNGTVFQNGNTRDMIFGMTYLVAYLSQFMTLAAGDIIATGTPSGVGAGIKPEPVFLRDGDVVKLGATGLGTQTHSVIQG